MVTTRSRQGTTQPQVKVNVTAGLTVSQRRDLREQLTRPNSHYLRGQLSRQNSREQPEHVRENGPVVEEGLVADAPPPAIPGIADVMNRMMHLYEREFAARAMNAPIGVAAKLCLKFSSPDELDRKSLEG